MAKWPGKLSDRPIGEFTGTGGAPRESAWKRYSLSMYTAPQSPPSAGGRTSPVNLLALPDASMTASPVSVRPNTVTPRTRPRCRISPSTWPV
jgi:hypothetical protein